MQALIRLRAHPRGQTFVINELDLCTVTQDFTVAKLAILTRKYLLLLKMRIYVRMFVFFTANYPRICINTTIHLRTSISTYSIHASAFQSSNLIGWVRFMRVWLGLIYSVVRAMADMHI